MDGFDCCDKTNCPGSCDFCGFSKCPMADYDDQCKGQGSCHESEDDMEMTDALSRADYVRGYYKRINANEGICDVTDTADIIADLLRSLPRDKWEETLGKAAWHAHEEVHGWGSGRPDCVMLYGLEFWNAG